jgi:hypothetical protein
MAPLARRWHRWHVVSTSLAPLARRWHVFFFLMKLQYPQQRNASYNPYTRRVACKTRKVAI